MIIKIGFSRPKALFAPFSWVIRLFQGWTSYSHVYVRFWNQEAQRWVVYQASGTSVNMIGWEKFQINEIITDEFEIEVSDKSSGKIRSMMIDLLGTPYGILDVIGMGIVILINKLGFKVYNIFASKQYSMVCSKLAYEIADKIVPIPEEDPDLVTPKDMFNLLNNIKNNNINKVL